MEVCEGASVSSYKVFGTHAGIRQLSAAPAGGPMVHARRCVWTNESPRQAQATSVALVQRA